MPRTSDGLVRAHEPTVLDLTLARPGRIEGTVTDPSADAALEGVEVHLRTSQGEPLAMRLTDEQGAFRFDAVRAGSYQVAPIAPPGYVLDSGPQPVTVGPRQAVEAHFALRPGGQVRGTVLDEDTGEPLEGVTVTLHDSSGREVRRAQTHAGGVYEFISLPEDHYSVRVLDDEP